MTIENPFEPSFGNRPDKIVGRDQVIADIINGLDSRIGSRDRATVIIGPRGMGKTALLLEIESQAEQKGFVVGRSIANESMEDVLLERVQIRGLQHIKESKKRIKGFSAGALGFSVGLTFSDEVQANYGFESKLGLLCDRLAESGKGILLLVDEITASSPSMRSLTSAYQNLVGDKKNIAICMAGLPSAISNVLNDSVLTFLNRATQIELPPIDDAEVRNYYAQTLRGMGLTISEDVLDTMTDYVQGFPYLLQLLGYYTVRSAEQDAITTATIERALKSARKDLERSVFLPTLNALSNQDITFLEVLAKNNGVAKTSTIAERLGVANGYVQTYRKRLLDAGVIDSQRRGEVEITVPFLADYLKNQ